MSKVSTGHFTVNAGVEEAIRISERGVTVFNNSKILRFPTRISTSAVPLDAKREYVSSFLFLNWNVQLRSPWNRWRGERPKLKDLSFLISENNFQAMKFMPLVCFEFQMRYIEFFFDCHPRRRWKCCVKIIQKYFDVIWMLCRIIWRVSDYWQTAAAHHRHEGSTEGAGLSMLSKTKDLMT